VTVAMLSPPPVEVVADRERADLLLQHPLRTRILEAARQPASAAEMARALGVGAQKLNYHVRRLAEAGFLELMSEVERGNLVERRYRASALSFAVAPEALGPVAQGRFPESDRIAALHLLGRVERLRSEVVRALTEERATEVETLTLDAEVHLPTARARADFARAVREAVEEVVRRFPVPDDERTTDQAGSPKPADRYRILLGAWPAAGEARPTPSADEPTEARHETHSDRPDAVPEEGGGMTQ